MSYGSAVTYIDTLAPGRAKNSSNNAAIDWIVSTPESELNALAAPSQRNPQHVRANPRKPEHRTINAIMALAHHIPGMTNRDVERICTTLPTASARHSGG